MQAITNESDFNTNDKFMAVKFWASWCGPCKTMEPNIKKMEKEFPSVKFVSIDIDQVPTLAQKFRVKGLPTLLILKNGHETKRINGAVLIDPLRKVFRELTNSE